MIAGIVQSQRGDAKWLSPYIDLLDIWANFTIASLPDPANQLCTDDFEGPSPHNTNLAVKGIVALGAYAEILKAYGEMAKATYYREQAEAFVKEWITKADGGKGFFTRQFDLSSSWSQKYNLLFDKVLGLHLFPDSVYETEERFYQLQQKQFGIPLDDRHPYTKSDWSMWIAAMGSQEQFLNISEKLYNFADQTPDRAPFTDCRSRE